MLAPATIKSGQQYRCSKNGIVLGATHASLRREKPFIGAYPVNIDELLARISETIRSPSRFDRLTFGDLNREVRGQPGPGPNYGRLLAVQRGGQQWRREIELLPSRLDASFTIDYLLPKALGVAVPKRLKRQKAQSADWILVILWLHSFHS
jgi:hypothetical protein